MNRRSFLGLVPATIAAVVLERFADDKPPFDTFYAGSRCGKTMAGARMFGLAPHRCPACGGPDGVAVPVGENGVGVLPCWTCDRTRYAIGVDVGRGQDYSCATVFSPRGEIMHTYPVSPRTLRR